MDSLVPEGAGVLDQVVKCDLEKIETCNSAVFFNGQKVVITAPNEIGNWIGTSTVIHVEIAKDARAKGWISIDKMPEGIGAGSYLIVDQNAR